MFLVMQTVGKQRRAHTTPQLPCSHTLTATLSGDVGVMATADSTPCCCCTLQHHFTPWLLANIISRCFSSHRALNKLVAFEFANPENLNSSPS